MLRIKLNKNEAIPSYRFLFSGNTVNGVDENGILTFTYSGITSTMGGISVGDKLLFTKDDYYGKRLFSELATVVNVSENSVSVKRFKDIILNTVPVEEDIALYPPSFYNGSNPHKLRFFTFNINGYHCFTEETSGAVNNISEYVKGDYEDFNPNKRRCENDFVLYDECFLYRPTTLTAERKYSIIGGFDSGVTSWIGIKNRCNVTVKVKNDKIYDNVGSRGVNWEKSASDRQIYLKRCIVPVSYNGTNNLSQILWYGPTATFKGLLSEGIAESGMTTFSCCDERFYTANGSAVTLNDNVNVYLAQTDINIRTDFSNKFETNLLQKESLEKKFFLEKNKVIDYEKQIFYPVFNDSENASKDMLSITYDIYLRQRLGIAKPITTSEEQMAEYEENRKKWVINEDGYWNVPTDTTAITYNGGDLVGYAGFDDDDVYYQKKKVGMSFLRLSLYNTKDRLTQSLLGYSTIFLNTTELYKKYVQKKNKAENVEDEYMVFNSNEPKLGLSFSCANKYKTEEASEGFYLYLFPSLLTSQPWAKISGIDSDYKEIYMKVEFNNAKYGKKVPLIAPNGQPKNDYISYKNNDPDLTYVDMNSLFSDMYLRIGIKYDDNSKRYVWRFMDYEQIPELKINLFEPRINNANNT